MKIPLNATADGSTSEEEENPETELDQDDCLLRMDSNHTSRVSRRSRRTYRVGDVVDVRDADGIWYPAEISKVNLARKEIFVMFDGGSPGSWIPANSSVIAPLHAHTYDERGHFVVGQYVEACTDRGIWRIAVIEEVYEDCVKVAFRNSSANDDCYIHSPIKRIRTFRKGSSNTYRRWKVPGTLETNRENASANGYQSREDDIDNKENKPDDNRTRQITATSDRFGQYIMALEGQGLRVFSVSGDGNCLFRSVAHQVYGNDELHALVREKCMDYMEADSEFFAQFVEGGLEAFPFYLNAKRINGCWGDDPEIQAISELYGRRAEIWAYDSLLGARKLRTFHESVSTSGPAIVLSYYGGGHYDSIMSPHTSAHWITGRAPGQLEDEVIRHMLERPSRSRSSARDGSAMNSISRSSSSEAVCSDAAIAMSAAEREAIGLAQRLSRDECFSWAQQDLEDSFLLAIESKEIAAGSGLVGAESGLDAPMIAESKMPSLLDAASDIAAAQQGILKSVAEESEREYLDKAIMSSLQDDSKVTEDDLIELAKKESMKFNSDKSDEKFMGDESLELALKLSAMSEEEALRYALEKSVDNRFASSSRGLSQKAQASSSSSSSSSSYPTFDCNDEDALLQAAINESMASLASGPASASTGLPLQANANAFADFDEMEVDDPELMLALQASLQGFK